MLKAFLSYSVKENEHDDLQISKLRQRLESELQIYVAGFEILQDTDDVEVADEWIERLRAMVFESHLFIAVLSPAWFRSDYCRQELEWFLERETALGAKKRIIPICYRDCDEMRDANDQLAVTLSKRQRLNRNEELCFVRLDQPDGRKLIADLANRIRPIIRKLLNPPKPPVDLEPAGAVAADKPIGQPAAVAPPVNPPVRPPVVKPVVKPVQTPPVRLESGGVSTEHETIEAAIEAARDNDKIYLLPGTYRVSLNISHAIEIIGDGPRDAVLIEAFNGPAIRFDAPYGRLRNLAFKKAGQRELNIIEVRQGQVVIEGCNMTGKDCVCIAIESGADPSLRHNHLFGARVGVTFQEGAKGTVDFNIIDRHAHAGIEVAAQASATIQHNVFWDLAQHGVYIQGRATLKSNDISYCKGTGVEIQHGYAELEQNHIHHGKIGVRICDRGRADIKDNDIYENVSFNVEVCDHSIPKLLNNRIHHSKVQGIWISTHARGEFSKNHIFSNEKSGVEIGDSAAPTLTDNNIFHNREYGILVKDHASGEFTGNNIHSNRFAALEVIHQGAPSVRRNRLHNGPWGILVRNDARGTYEDNDVFENRDGGVCSHSFNGFIAEADRPVFRANRIFRNRKAAILVENCGAAMLIKNQLWGNLEEVQITEDSQENVGGDLDHRVDAPQGAGS
jgi:parallel beta-helix repeat protein